MLMMLTMLFSKLICWFLEGWSVLKVIEGRAPSGWKSERTGSD